MLLPHSERGSLLLIQRALRRCASARMEPVLGALAAPASLIWPAASAHHPSRRTASAGRLKAASMAFAVQLRHRNADGRKALQQHSYFDVKCADRSGERQLVEGARTMTGEIIYFQSHRDVRRGHCWRKQTVPPLDQQTARIAH